MPRLSKKIVAPHKALRKCKQCGIWHTESVHNKHGKGSFARSLGTNYTYVPTRNPKKKRFRHKLF